MPFQPMGIPGAFVFTPVRHEDTRGHFQESFKLSELRQEIGISFEVKQVNQSSSAKGVIRGIHFATSPPGQAKYVTCPKGKIWDVVVDLRTDSPTFGEWEGVDISADNGKSVVIPEGLGHAFLSLEKNSVVSYLCSEEYRPLDEHQINPLDPEIGIDFLAVAKKFGVEKFVLSDQDKKAQTLKAALRSGNLA